MLKILFKHGEYTKYETELLKQVLMVGIFYRINVRHTYDGLIRSGRTIGYFMRDKDA